MPFRIFDQPFNTLDLTSFLYDPGLNPQTCNASGTCAGQFDELRHDIHKSCSTHLGTTDEHVFKHIAAGWYGNDNELADISYGLLRFRCCSWLLSLHAGESALLSKTRFLGPRMEKGGGRREERGASRGDGAERTVAVGSFHVFTKNVTLRFVLRVKVHIFQRISIFMSSL